MSLRTKLAAISPTAKSAAVIAVGAVIAAIAWKANAGIAVEVGGVGLVGLGLILLAYVQVLGLLERGKASKFSRGLQGDVSEKFRAGWHRLSKAGKDKDPYFLPWYLMVGEPGAGKTQAIKHSNIKFVPGFNDPGAGEGGTLLMDWWFADRAIFLDTAGALLMDTARVSEFTEFLHRIRQYRPTPPVNGLILAIPANALTTDTDEEIQKKAQVIAQQLELVQRELGVRFPVYVIITKADLIGGFREFFDNLTDPATAYQILGWSNPSDLDGTFDPAEVELHLEAVAASLRRRRMGLILEPSAGADPNSPRIDRTDALYAFPEQLARTGSRLRTYLENVFMPSQWTDAPLFLRGIYFTSSMREGPPLDLDLARGLGIDPRKLPEDSRPWDKEKACFLRDLFIEKIFKEKGLVTAAHNVHQRVRRQNMMLIGAGLVTALVVIGFSVYGYQKFQQSVGKHAAFWAAVSRYDPAHPNAPITFEWIGKPPGTPLTDIVPPIQYGNASKLADLYAANLTLAQEPINTPAIFALANLFTAEVAGGSLGDARATAHRLLFEKGELIPTAHVAWGWLMKYEPLGQNMSWAWDAQPNTDNDNLGRKTLVDLLDLDRKGQYPYPPYLSKETEQHLMTATAADDPWSKTFTDSWEYFSSVAKLTPGSATFDPRPTVTRLKVVLQRIIDHNNQNFNHLTHLIQTIQTFDGQEAHVVEVMKLAEVINSDEFIKQLTDALKDLDTDAAALQQTAVGNIILAQLKKGNQDSLDSDVRLLNDVRGVTGIESRQVIEDAGTSLTALQTKFATLQDDGQLNDWNREILGDSSGSAYGPRLKGYHAVLDVWQGLKAPAGSLDADHLDAVKQAIAGAAAKLKQSAPVDLGETVRGKKAHDAIDAAIRAAAKRQIILVLGKMATSPPKPPADFANAPAVVQTIQHWQQAHQLLEANDLEPADVQHLQGVMDQSQAPLIDYLNRYAAYWSSPKQIDLPVDKVPDSAAAVSAKLTKQGNAALAALQVVFGAQAPKWLTLDPLNNAKAATAINDISSGLARLPDYTKQADDFLSGWKQLTSADILDARQTLANDPPDQVQRLHAFPETLPPQGTDFVARYWSGVAKKVYGDFTARCQAGIKAALAKLTAQIGFPIDWKKSDSPMSWQSVADNAALVGKLRVIPADPWVKQVIFPPSAADVPKLDALGTRLDYWANKAQVVISLAQPTDPSVPAEVNSADYKARLDSLPYYARFGDSGQILNRNEVKLPLKSPADDGFSLQFVDTTTNTAADSVNATGGPGQWAILKLLTNPDRAQHADPSIWYLKQTSQKGNPVWLKVSLAAPPGDFTAPLP